MNRYLKADDRSRKQMIGLVLVPREDIIDAWKTDYEQMVGSMIYGEKPTWDELMQAMKELQERVRKCVNGLMVYG